VLEQSLRNAAPAVGLIDGQSVELKVPAARASDDRSNNLVSITCKEERLGVAVKQAMGGVCLVSANALSDREAVLLAQGRTDTIEWRCARFSRRTPSRTT
jgi:hypothetical protein